MCGEGCVNIGCCYVEFLLVVIFIIVFYLVMLLVFLFILRLIG